MIVDMIGFESLIAYIPFLTFRHIPASSPLVTHKAYATTITNSFF